MTFLTIKNRFIAIFNKKNKILTVKKTHLFVILSLSILFYFLATSFFWYFLGDTFFGKNPKLYNVKFANVFFINAAYPLIGKPVSQAHFQLSRTYFIRGYLDAAILEAEKELQIYPENTKAYYILGLTYGYLNQEADGIEAFSKYIETHPTTWAGRNDKAWLQFRTGDIDGALLTIKPVALSVGLYNVWVQNTYGTLLMNKHRYTEAREAFLRAWESANVMTEESWGVAYPGNDPRIYSGGLQATKQSILDNLKLIAEKMSVKRK